MINKLDTNELLYLWKENHNQMAHFLLLDRFLNKIYYTIIGKYNTTYYNLPFEMEDFYSLTYENLLSSIKEFNYLQNNYRFEQFSLIKAKTFVFREVKKYLKSSHTCLNQAYSYSRNIITDYGLRNSKDIVDNKLLENIEKESNLKEFSMIANSTKDECTREIIKLRLDGFKNREIANMLNMTAKQVNNRFYSFFSKCKKNIVY